MINVTFIDLDLFTLKSGGAKFKLKCCNGVIKHQFRTLYLITSSFASLLAFLQPQSLACLGDTKSCFLLNNSNRALYAILFTSKNTIKCYNIFLISYRYQGCIENANDGMAVEMNANTHDVNLMFSALCDGMNTVSRTLLITILEHFWSL